MNQNARDNGMFDRLLIQLIFSLVEDQDSQIKIIYEQERIIKELNAKIAEFEVKKI